MEDFFAVRGILLEQVYMLCTVLIAVKLNIYVFQSALINFVISIL